VIELAPGIESSRQSKESYRDFSYRFEPDSNGTLFSGSRTYKDWLHAQQHILASSLKYKTVVTADISDFYARVNFHRLENLLDEVAPKHGAASALTPSEDSRGDGSMRV
jgi:hypothetical protein